MIVQRPLSFVRVRLNISASAKKAGAVLKKNMMMVMAFGGSLGMEVRLRGMWRPMSMIS